MTQPQNSPAPGAEQSESGASVVSENKYHGGPCKNCGGTLRYKSNRNCVACQNRRSNEWSREKYRTDPEWVEMMRERDRRYSERYRTDPEWVERRRKQTREWYREKYRTDREYAERQLDRNREARRERIERGLCASCGQPKLSEWYCWDCLNKKGDYDLRRFVDGIGI